MYIAKHGHGEFRAFESRSERRRTGRLRTAPLPIVPRQRVYVVHRGIVIFDGHRLAGHERHHVRLVHAIFLREDHRIGGRGELVSAEAAFHINDDVGKSVVRAGYDDRRHHWRRVSARAGRRGAHIDGTEAGRRALKPDRSYNGRRGGRIHGRRKWRGWRLAGTASAAGRSEDRESEKTNLCVRYPHCLGQKLRATNNH